jgi:gluconolactonase
MVRHAGRKIDSTLKARTDLSQHNGPCEDSGVRIQPPSMYHLLRIPMRIILFFVLALSVLAQDSLIAEGATLRKLASGMRFTEGPVWLPTQKILVFSDIPNAKLMQWTAADGLSVFRDSKHANGNLLDLEGRLLTCQHSGRALVRTEPDGSITVLADKFEGKRFNSPNDVAVKPDGSLWFTDPPWGLKDKSKREIAGHWVYRLDPKTGRVDVVIRNLAMPNGIAFSPDGNRLYVADTGGHPAVLDPELRKAPAQIHAYAVAADHSLKELFRIDTRCDGMAVDVAGNLYTTHKGIGIYDADGKQLETIDVPEGPANVCFGDEDYKTLFITARTSLYSIRMRLAGAKPKGAKW